jgi:hypothetical protein
VVSGEWQVGKSLGGWRFEAVPREVEVEVELSRKI